MVPVKLTGEHKRLVQAFVVLKHLEAAQSRPAEDEDDGDDSEDGDYDTLDREAAPRWARAYAVANLGVIVDAGKKAAAMVTKYYDSIARAVATHIVDNTSAEALGAEFDASFVEYYDHPLVPVLLPNDAPELAAPSLPQPKLKGTQAQALALVAHLCAPLLPLEALAGLLDRLCSKRPRQLAGGSVRQQENLQQRLGRGCMLCLSANSRFW